MKFEKKLKVVMKNSTSLEAFKKKKIVNALANFLKIFGKSLKK